MVNSKDQIASSVNCFAFNGDCTNVALSPNDSSIIIYKIPSLKDIAEKWVKIHTLLKHDSIVSSIDWSAVTNIIVSCGHDRNAYVWIFNQEENKWVPSLVILRINRAANWVRWNNNGTKFAVGSSSKIVPVCRYEHKNDWWVSKMIKKHKSTVLSVAWHPNNIFLLTGSCDNKCRIFSAFIDELDQFEDEEQFSGMFPNQKRFGSLLVEIDCAKLWVEDVCWSPNGLDGAFVSHDPAITFFRLSHGAENNIILNKKKLPKLPFRAVEFLDENRVVAAGHENNPYLYIRRNESADWDFKEKVDKETGSKQKETVSKFAAHKAMFQKTTTRGEAFDIKETILSTRHQKQIVGLFGLKSNGAGTFFSCGLDGRLLHWNV